jgi:predicted aldo/keto reductase-like oxidoreductase
LTKLNALADLETSLRNLKTDRINIYQLHNVSTEDAWEKIKAPGGALEALYQARDTGKVDHIGVTSHNIPLIGKIIRENIFETVLVQLNYLAPETEEEFLPLCKKMNIGVVIMKPFAGGALSNASTALKYVLANDDVDVVIPGMMRVSEVEKNVTVASGRYVLTGNDKKLIDKDKKELGEKFCRACNYCQPCTQGIPIFSLLRSETDVKRMGLTPQKEKQLQEDAKKAGECIECGTCETRCPYHLPIRELLKVKRKYIEELLEKRGQNG